MKCILKYLHYFCGLNKLFIYVIPKRQKINNYLLLPFSISLSACLPSLSVLITNQVSKVPINKVNNNNEMNETLYNLFIKVE